MTRSSMRWLILAAGWSELEASSDDTLYVVDEIDRESLLPRCAAAVHHGGACTVRTTLAAGPPTHSRARL